MGYFYGSVGIFALGFANIFLWNIPAAALAFVLGVAICKLEFVNNDLARAEDGLRTARKHLDELRKRIAIWDGIIQKLRPKS